MEDFLKSKVCKRCGSEHTYIRKNGYEQWSFVDGERYCSTCIYHVSERIRTAQQKRNTRENPKHIAFLGTIKVLTFDPKRHVCGKCGSNKLTHMHHWMYVPIMPWACTEELCAKCHGLLSYTNGEIIVGKYSKSFFGKAENNPRWRGGVKQTNQRWRKVAAYDKWRAAVLERDGYRCTECGSTELKLLEAHHIIKADDNPELRYDVNNGITYCRKCHNEKRKKRKKNIT